MPVTPRRIYDAWLSSEEHTAFTGSPADVSSRKGGKFTAHAGYIEGANVELEKGTRIVQTWRTRDFPEGADDSQLEITFLQSESGTRIVINHGGIPEGQGERYHAGWGKNYFKPMSRYFLNQREAPEVLQRSARNAAQKAAHDAGPPKETKREEAAEEAAPPAPKSASARKHSTVPSSSAKTAASKTAASRAATSQAAASKAPASKPGARRKAPGPGDETPRSTRQRAKPAAAPTNKKARRAAPAASTSKPTAKSKTRKPAKRKSG
ncbi:MAG: SRPBCC domain-containing protein [Polyangiaceae bacterium]|nr:SRPBCC domain-containing protein [Myxococcales bacterium]MCB9590832.1 SRPBCC domain-containing protein [Polyangiaceae bacterium]